MKNIKYWIEAMRLRTLPVSVAGVITAIGYSISSDTFKWLPALLCLTFAVLCQIASNFANEYYDYKAGRDRIGREGPRRGVTEGDIAPTAMKRAIYAVLAAAALTGLSLTLWGGLWLTGAGILIGAGVLAYSTGPWPLSTHCLGEVAVVFFFGIIPVNLTYYVQSLQWSADVFLGSLAIGLMGANVLIVNNYRDIADDIAVCKHTLATTFGRKAMLALYFCNALGAALFMWTVWAYNGIGWLAVPVAYLVCSAAVTTAIRRADGARLTPFLGITAVLMLLYSVCFCVMCSMK